MELVNTVVQIAVGSILFFILFAIVTVLVMYIVDVTQTKQTIRRNYPVVGRFRYFFEHMGQFFRQYFFTMDREEMPFNRAQRSWCYQAAKNMDTTVAFGSSKNLKVPGTVIFSNCPYPTLKEDAVEPDVVTIGESCKIPFRTASLFNISGMSYGALSKPAVLALSKGAAMAGCWMNTGEGGLYDYHLSGNADLVFQIGTAKNGVRNSEGKLCDEKLREVAAHEHVRMFEIKLSQGAKPGKGGIVPAAKITEEIAKVRGIKVGQDAISPNRHPDIRNDDELLDMIARIKEVTGKPVGFKAVIGGAAWLDSLFTKIRHRGIESAPDFITVDGAEGGTGAAPLPLIDDMGIPLGESLPMLVDKLNTYGLRGHIKVVASGKLITPGDVAWALCSGADFITSARGFMFSLGCIQALQCNKNTCPTGITTHNKKLQRGLVPEDKAVRVTNYVNNMVHEVGVIAHACGVKTPRQLKRHHARVVMPDGFSKPLNELNPEVVPLKRPV